MAAKDTSGPPQTTRRAGDTEEPGVVSAEKAGERPRNPSGDVGAILDDMDEALEDNADEIVRFFVQEGGQ
jgi:ubiquitin-like protein Pup